MICSLLPVIFMSGIFIGIGVRSMKIGRAGFIWWAIWWSLLVVGVVAAIIWLIVTPVMWLPHMSVGFSYVWRAVMAALLGCAVASGLLLPYTVIIWVRFRFWPTPSERMRGFPVLMNDQQDGSQQMKDDSSRTSA